MNTNRYFSFSRLGLVMKRDFMENWKTNLYTFIGVFCGFMAVYLAMMASYEGTSFSALKAYIDSHVESFATITGFLLIIGASMIMKNMQSKEMRLSCLMLPATLLEKFIARAFYVTIGLVSVALLASFLAEIVHWLLMPMFELPEELKICVWPEAWGKMIEEISPFKVKSVLLINNGVSETVERSLFFEYIFAYMVALWWHSLYILGGNFWNKWSWVKTTITIVLVCIILVWIGVHVHWSSDMIEKFNDFFQTHNWIDESVIGGLFAFIFFCLTAFNWWLSYKLFTRQQVIRPKFRLL